MTRAGLAAQLGVVLGARVGVLDDRGDGCAGGVPINYASDNVGGVGLAALGCGLVTAGGATVQKGLELLQVDGDACRNAIERAADSGGVRLAEDA